MTNMVVDEHDHIKSLKDRADRKFKERKNHEDSKKLENERESDIAEAKQSMMKDFWCDECGIDITLLAQKVVESDWTNKSQRIAYYVGQCPCGCILRRRITDSWSDPYYLVSDSLNKQRTDNYKDIVQPWESGYNMLYGHKK
jgi:hypothetical protein